MAERREQRESEAPSAASQASLKQRKERAEKLSQAGMHRARQNQAVPSPAHMAPGPAQPPVCCSSPAARSRVGGSGTWHPTELVMPQKPNQAGAFPLAQPAQLPCATAEVSAPSHGTRGFCHAVPACLAWLPPARLRPLGTMGAAGKPQAGGIHHFPSAPLQGASSLPFSRQTPGHPGQPLHICILSLRKHDVLFPVTHSLSFSFPFFFLFKGTTSAVHTAEAKRLLFCPTQTQGLRTTSSLFPKADSGGHVSN